MKTVTVQAGVLLMNAGMLPALSSGYDLGWTWARDNGVKIVTDVVDVDRKKDLHNAGRALAKVKA